MILFPQFLAANHLNITFDQSNIYKNGLQDPFLLIFMLTTALMDISQIKTAKVETYSFQALSFFQKRLIFGIIKKHVRI